jgi:hypothetical protein
MLPLVLAGLLLRGIIDRALHDFGVLVLLEVHPQVPDGTPVMLPPVSHFIDSVSLALRRVRTFLLTPPVCTTYAIGKLEHKALAHVGVDVLALLGLKHVIS